MLAMLKHCRMPSSKMFYRPLQIRLVRPAMSAKVTILSQAATDADQKAVTALNPKTVVDRDGKKVVFRVKGDTVEMVAINLGRKIGDNQEITGNLQSGDKLVLSPDAKLVAGKKIVITTK